MSGELPKARSSFAEDYVALDGSDPNIAVAHRPPLHTERGFSCHCTSFTVMELTRSDGLKVGCIELLLGDAGLHVSLLPEAARVIANSLLAIADAGERQHADQADAAIAAARKAGR